jgi:hypothetical protein
MSPSLRALLTGIIDYAGLFPPAQLPLNQAIRNYARYRHEPENWMLGRFICPAARLGELAPFRDELFRHGPPFAFSALGRSGQNLQDLVTGLKADLEAIAAFQERRWEDVVVDALEIRVPEECYSQPPEKDLAAARITGLIAGCVAMIDHRKLPPLIPYFEADLRTDWRARVAVLVARVAAERHTRGPGTFPHCPPPGVKLRCGGLETQAFPSSEQVAFTMIACRDAGVPLKFTAGLHHPIRRFDAGVQMHMHGFLNVFVAGVLAHARRLSQEQVQRIIEDEDPTSFHFDDAGLRWKDWHATVDEITAVRRHAVTSFGSCSFDEPRDDLRALGLLD